jgi:hypothetical protein
MFKALTDRLPGLDRLSRLHALLTFGDEAVATGFHHANAGEEVKQVEFIHRCVI